MLKLCFLPQATVLKDARVVKLEVQPLAESQSVVAVAVEVLVLVLVVGCLAVEAAPPAQVLR